MHAMFSNTEALEENNQRKRKARIKTSAQNGKKCNITECLAGSLNNSVIKVELIEKSRAESPVALFDRKTLPKFISH